MLLHPAETKNRYVWIESFRTSHNDVLAALEESTGKKWEVKHVKAAEQIKLGRDLLSKGSIMQGIPLLIVGSILNADVDTGADFSKTRKLDNDVLGLPKESLQSTEMLSSSRSDGPLNVCPFYRQSSYTYGSSQSNSCVYLYLCLCVAASFDKSFPKKLFHNSLWGGVCWQSQHQNPHSFLFLFHVLRASEVP